MSVGLSISAPVEHVHYVQDARSKFDAVFAEISPDHFKSPELIKALLKSYSDDEVQAIFEDFTAIREKTFKNAQKEPIFILTSGGPGSGKSTHLETILEFQRDESVNHLATDCGKYAYVDPDRHALFFMKNTFSKDIASGKRDPKAAYEYWRNASNVIADVLLALALKDGYATAYGTTMTAPPAIIEKIMTNIKNTYGYSVEMHHLSASDDIRVESIKAREANGIVQATEQDVRSKGKMFFERLPAYVANIDTLRFFYRKDMTTVQEAAVKTSREFRVLNQEALDEVRKLHDVACDRLGYFDEQVVAS